MNLAEYLLKKQTAIINKRQNSVIETNVDDTKRFIKKEKNLFATTVGRTISQNIEQIDYVLFTDGNLVNISSSVDNII